MKLPDLTPHQRAVFSAIYAHPGLTAQEIGLLARLSPTRVSRTLSRLEDAGMVHTTRYRPRNASKARTYAEPAPWTTA